MSNYLLLLFLSFSLSATTKAQSSSLFTQYQDSSVYRIVMKTQNFNGTENIALDNFTIKFKNGETKVYYIRYGDMLISSLTIPYSMLDRFIEFEKQVRSVKCTDSDCVDSILFDDGNEKFEIPIDILYEELVSSLMIELEQTD
ncbi:MAG TPA: hypothetical protein EYG86_05195 [Crocinitomicaceae bacterium]|nr:hypothetical protein [Crocinitomicaceae bacterium]